MQCPGSACLLPLSMCTLQSIDVQSLWVHIEIAQYGCPDCQHNNKKYYAKPEKFSTTKPNARRCNDILGVVVLSVIIK